MCPHPSPPVGWTEIHPIQSPILVIKKALGSTGSRPNSCLLRLSRLSRHKVSIRCTFAFDLILVSDFRSSDLSLMSRICNEIAICD